MTPDPFDRNPALERAVSEIRDEEIPAEVVEAAGARVWERLKEPREATPGLAPLVLAGEHLRDCADFQALFPDFRARRLPAARALLVEDHLHECVACRRVFEGKVVPFEQPLPKAKSHHLRWAVAAGAIAASGLVAWFAVVQFRSAPGRAIVQSVNGMLYEVSPAGIRVMAAGEPLPDGVEIRTARDSTAMVALRDGSLLEMRERSDFSAVPGGSDLTVHLGHGSIIVQAAKRRSGHLYIATADCRVAVTGTVFGVSAGVKGSRVSVIAGEVHVTQDNRETVLHPGDQMSTSESLEPASLRADFAWSHNPTLLRQLAALRDNLSRLRMPQVRYSSRLVGLLPASTAFFASIPNLSDYLADAQEVFRQSAEENAELRAWLAGPGAGIGPVLEKLRAAYEYLGDEIAIFSTPQHFGPVFLAETKRDGFAEFLQKSGLPLHFATRGKMVLFSPNRDALMVALDSSFQQTPFYSRIADAYRRGAGILVCADLVRTEPPHPVPAGMRYLVAEQTQVGAHTETRADISFDGPRTGPAGWLADPSPMGALDYISPEAGFVLAFTTSQPAAIFEQVSGRLPETSALDLPEKDLAASLGGEFAIAEDGPLFPVPSWKLVAEVYDPARLQSAIQKAVSASEFHLSQEVSGGRTFYTITAAKPNPLTEAHYTFASGYLVAAPTKALVTHALEMQSANAGIARSPGFMALLPRDPYPDVSALLYQNFGSAVAPFAGLLGPKADQMTHAKPFLLAAYGEPDRIALASTGDLLGAGFNNMLSGGILQLAQTAVPWKEIVGALRQPAPTR
jgi:ferric-dicitrate binding protein FerR (iron transport regulator)